MQRTAASPFKVVVFLVFPNDINKKINDKRRVAGDNAMQLYFTLFVLGNIVFFFIYSWANLSFFGAGLWLPLFALVLTDIFAGILVFRFLIFDENAKIREVHGFSGDSIAKYVKIRKDMEHTLDAHGRKVHAMEFDNGSLAFIMELKFGCNDDIAAAQTKGVLTRLFSIAHAELLETRFCIMTENFGRSDEYQAYVQSVNKIQKSKLRNALILISEAVMKRHREISNVSCIYFMVRSSASYQRAYLEDVLRNYIKVLAGSNAAFREIKFLDNEEALSFFTEFYGVGAIDLSTTQAIDLAKDIDESFSNLVSIYSYETTDGKTFVNSSPVDFGLEEKEVN